MQNYDYQNLSKLTPGLKKRIGKYAMPFFHIKHSHAVHHSQSSVTKNKISIEHGF